MNIITVKLKTMLKVLCLNKKQKKHEILMIEFTKYLNRFKRIEGKEIEVH